MFCIILVSDLNDGNVEKYNLTKVSVGCISILAVIGVFLWNHVSKTILIGNNTLSFYSLFKSEQIPIKEIKGYKSSRYDTIIIPHNKGRFKKIRISKSLPLNDWLSKNLSYLGLAWF